MKKIIIVISLFISTSLVSGCFIVPIIPFMGTAYEGYTIWRGDEAIKYYTHDFDTICRAVNRACEQMKLKTTVKSTASEKQYSLEIEGNNPMHVNVLPVENNVTKITVRTKTFGDKQYAEFFLKAVDDNIPSGIKPGTTDRRGNHTPA